MYVISTAIRLGRGFINTNSKIRIRMMTRNENQEIDREFLKMRVRDAWEYRKKTVDISSCRVIFGEADFLPGMVIDKFSDVLVVQSLALGIDKLKMIIIEELKSAMAEDGITIRGVYERSDAKVRLQEGMERVKGFIGEPFDTKVQIVENGVKYIVDIEDGQKTGFFLDQKYNRLAIQRLCKDAESFRLLYAYRFFCIKCGNCRSKECNRSRCFSACSRPGKRKRRVKRTQKRVKFICEDVFELLPKLESRGEKVRRSNTGPACIYKIKKFVKNAVKGYREINLRA